MLEAFGQLEVNPRIAGGLGQRPLQPRELGGHVARPTRQTRREQTRRGRVVPTRLERRRGELARQSGITGALGHPGARQSISRIRRGVDPIERAPQRDEQSGERDQIMAVVLHHLRER